MDITETAGDGSVLQIICLSGVRKSKSTKSQPGADV